LYGICHPERSDGFASRSSEGFPEAEAFYALSIKTRRTRSQCLTLRFDTISHVEGGRRLTNRVTHLPGGVRMGIVPRHEIAAHRVARRLRQCSRPFSKVPK